MIGEPAPASAGSAPSRDPRQPAERRSAQGREAQVALRRISPQAQQDDRPERAHCEARERGPVDEGEVPGDLLGRHREECSRTAIGVERAGRDTAAAAAAAVAAAGVAGRCRPGRGRQRYDCAGGATRWDSIRRRRSPGMAMPAWRSGPPAGRRSCSIPWFGNPKSPKPADAVSGVRSHARDPWPRGPHGRRRRSRQPAPPDLAVHPRDEPVAGSAAPRRGGRR